MDTHHNLGLTINKPFQDYSGSIRIKVYLKSSRLSSPPIPLLRISQVMSMKLKSTLRKSMKKS